MFGHLTMNENYLGKGKMIPTAYCMAPKKAQNVSIIMKLYYI